ncbi:hypothetical protein ACHAXR_008147 [Thalassiosira sp. AJA248-18]
MTAATGVGDTLNPTTLAKALWNNQEDSIKNAGFQDADALEVHLQHIVDVYSEGEVYDNNSTIRNTKGAIVQTA